MKAGKSSATVMVLSSLATNSLAMENVCSLVAMPRTSFDQFHHRNRVHEMYADELLRPVSGRGKAGDRNGRGVGGQYRIGAQNRANSGKYLFLGRFVFGRRFDHQIASGKISNRIGRLDVLECGGADVFGDLAGGDLTGEAGADCAHALFDPLGRDVMQQDVNAGQCADLGNA